MPAAVRHHGPGVAQPPAPSRAHADPPGQEQATEGVERGRTRRWRYQARPATPLDASSQAGAEGHPAQRRLGGRRARQGAREGRGDRMTATALLCANDRQGLYELIAKAHELKLTPVAFALNA